MLDLNNVKPICILEFEISSFCQILQLNTDTRGTGIFNLNNFKPYNWSLGNKQFQSDIGENTPFLFTILSSFFGLKCPKVDAAVLISPRNMNLL